MKEKKVVDKTIEKRQKKNRLKPSGSFLKRDHGFVRQCDANLAGPSRQVCANARYFVAISDKYRLM